MDIYGIYHLGCISHYIPGRISQDFMGFFPHPKSASDSQQSSQSRPLLGGVLGPRCTGWVSQWRCSRVAREPGGLRFLVFSDC